MLTLLTTTGERPECFALLQKFMRVQDYSGKVRWVIVDDGKEPINATFKKNGWTVEHIRPKPFWQPGQNTQHRNLAAGLDSILADASVVVIEDDDYYSPQYLSTVQSHLDNGFNLVGEKWPRYFNCFTGCGALLKSGMHTSLAATGIKGDALVLFRECVKRGLKYVDIDLWQKYKGNKKLYGADNCIGIKGMPGRGGIGGGHKLEFGSIVDPVQYLGDAYQFYKPFIRHAPIEGAQDMKVKTIKKHPYGGHYRNIGDEYFIPNPVDRKVLLAVGVIEMAEQPEPPKKKPGRPPKKKAEPTPVDNPVDTVDNTPVEEAEAIETKEEIETPRVFGATILKGD